MTGRIPDEPQLRFDAERSGGRTVLAWLLIATLMAVFARVRAVFFRRYVLAPVPAGIRPEWYFLAPFYTLKLLPSHIWFFEGELVGFVAFGLLALWWAALPFWAAFGAVSAGRPAAATVRQCSSAGVWCRTHPLRS